MLITLTGGAGSGKTTLARALANTGATVLHGDDHYFTAPEDGGVWAFDADGGGPWLDVGDPASIDFPRLNAATATALAGGGIVIVEGLFARMVAPGVACSWLDVFVDTAADLRLARKIERKCVHGSFPLEVLLRNYLTRRREQHELFVEPLRTTCGLVVDGTAPVELAVKAVRRAAGTA